MIDLDEVRKKYASMPNSELISFAAEEGHLLTTESFGLLKAEFINRGLDHFIIKDIEGSKISAQSSYTAQSNETEDSHLSYVFDQKEYGKHNLEIIAGLIERGLEEAQAMQIVSTLPITAKQRLKKAELEKLTGGLILIIGIAINFLPLRVNSNRLVYILAWCLILFGTSRYIKGSYYKGRFKKILYNFTMESGA